MAAGTHLHTPHDVVDRERGQHIYGKPALEVAPRYGFVVCYDVTCQRVLQAHGNAGRRLFAMHACMLLLGDTLLLRGQ